MENFYMPFKKYDSPGIYSGMNIKDGCMFLYSEIDTDDFWSDHFYEFTKEETEKFLKIYTKEELAETYSVHTIVELADKNGIKYNFYSR